MARSDMRDFEWDFIEKLLPNKSRGVKRVDDRRVMAFCTLCALASRGGICLNSTARGQRLQSLVKGRDLGHDFRSYRGTSIPSWWIPLRFEPILLPRS